MTASALLPGFKRAALAATLLCAALWAGHALAQGMEGDNSGYCCYSDTGGDCEASDDVSCAGGGYYFTYGGDSTDCDAYCKINAVCGNGIPEEGECGPGGSCLEDCPEFKECSEYESQGDCEFAAGCHWYNDEFGSFCERELYFCGDEYCTAEDGEDESNCPRDCSPRCGNGVVDGDEECEPSLDSTCNEACYHDVCGDGVVGEYEYCDPDTGNSGDPEVADEGDGDCNQYCEFSWCGDGIEDYWVNASTGEYEYEQCDDGNNVSGDGCGSDCTLEECGNDIRDIIDQATGELEPCDDGNNVSGDGCSEYCEVEECGNGETDEGEDCDQWDDWNDGDTDQCNYDCTWVECGDGYENQAAGEDCDLGADNSDEPNSICHTDCTLGACGDGIVDPEYDEQCDDGDLNDDDYGSCTTDCKWNACGNGHVEAAYEDCDPYKNTGTTGMTDDPGVADGMSEFCTNECTWSACGDGIVNDQDDEECDPDTGTSENPYEAADDSDSCTYFCTETYCGDGYTNFYAGEDCDPGWTCANGDDCTYFSDGDTCSDGSACEIRDTEDCTTECTYPDNADILCCTDYNWDEDYYQYGAQEGLTGDECDTEGGYQVEYEGPLTSNDDMDYWCGYVGACCYVDEEGYDVAEASTEGDCYGYGDYVAAVDTDLDGDGIVTRSEAETACEYKVEYVCQAGGGGTERRMHDGLEVLDEESYVADNEVYVTQDPNDPYCDTVYVPDTCEVKSFAQAMLDGNDFFTSEGFCQEDLGQ